MNSQVIILNGVGSVGKSSVARALQNITIDPFLHVSMDAFLDMLPESLSGHPDGVTFESIRQDGLPSVVIRTGPVAERAFRGMRHAIAAMAAQGNNLIVDDVMLGKEAGRDYEKVLSSFRVHLVGLFAPLDLLEARERARGDRMIGLARWQYDRVHRGLTYDLEIDTSRSTSSECATQIKEALRL